MMNVMWVDTTDFTKRIARYVKVQKGIIIENASIRASLLDLKSGISKREELEKYDGK
jgi:hypothetical protein